MIKEAIKNYDATQERLGAGADAMDIGTKERSEYIEKYKQSLAKQEKEVAEWMHVNYEQIAKGKDWNTQESCKVDFDSLPKDNQNVMLELAKRILNTN